MEPHLEEETGLHKHLVSERMWPGPPLKKVATGQLGGESFVAVGLRVFDERGNEWTVGESTVRYLVSAR